MVTSELITALSIEKNITIVDAKKYIEKMFDLIKQNLIDGKKVELREFGNFRVRQYKQYMGRNPKTSQKILVKSKKIVHFKYSKKLMEVNL